MDNFYDYFKNLISREDDNATEFEHTVDHNTVFENLDKNITISEIESAIKKLKAGKSCAEDGLVNELFMKCSNVLLPLLYRLFNKILNCGHFPAAWATGCIIPIFKKGDSNDPNNYRGITIVSCLGKLFTSILCNRIFEWNSENDVITDAQFGFKPGFSTIDAIFVLQSLINRTLKKKKEVILLFY